MKKTLRYAGAAVIAICLLCLIPFVLLGEVARDLGDWLKDHGEELIARNQSGTKAEAPTP